MLITTLKSALVSAHATHLPFPYAYGNHPQIASLLKPLALSAMAFSQRLRNCSLLEVEDGLGRITLRLPTHDFSAQRLLPLSEDMVMTELLQANSFLETIDPSESFIKKIVATDSDLFGADVYELPEMINKFLERQTNYPPVAKDNITLESRIVFDFGTKPLLPHTDSGRKVFSLLFPLSCPEFGCIDQVEGTSILKPWIPSLRSFRSTRFPPILFRTILETKHEIGNFLAFRKTNHSWHAVYPTCSQRTFPRLTLLLNVVTK